MASLEIFALRVSSWNSPENSSLILYFCRVDSGHALSLRIPQNWGAFDFSKNLAQIKLHIWEKISYAGKRFFFPPLACILNFQCSALKLKKFATLVNPSPVSRPLPTFRAKLARNLFFFLLFRVASSRRRWIFPGVTRDANDKEFTSSLICTIMAATPLDPLAVATATFLAKVLRRRRPVTR